MIFPPDQTHRLLSGEIKVTRRPVTKAVFRQGDVLKLQPKGKPAMANLRITAVHSEPVELLDDEGARAEGFEDRDERLKVWLEEHGAYGEAWVLSFEVFREQRPRLLHKRSGYTEDPMQAMSLEPEAVDAETQARITAGQLRSDAQRRWDQHNARAAVRRELRSLKAQLTEAEARAHAKDLDVTPELARVREAIRDMNRKLEDAA